MLSKASNDTLKNSLHQINSRINISAAAGDDDEQLRGVWVQSFSNMSKQKSTGDTSEYLSGYKTKGFGNMIGVDGLINDNLLLGLSYMNAYMKVKPQDQKAGDQTKVRSQIMSLYGSYDFSNNWFVSGIASYGQSTIKNYEIRELAIARNTLSQELATSKYRSYLYSGSVAAGYNYYTANNFNITPTLGMTWSKIKDGGYQEAGTSFQNLLVKKKSYNKLEATAGARISSNRRIRSITFVPSVYGFINYDFKGKSPAIDARLDGIDDPLPTIPFKNKKVSYNFGTTLMLKHSILEYGLDYNLSLAQKYLGQQVALKFKAYF